ncbi:NAD(P)/FAD-dependent oxidoreductase [Pseudoalteromonas pernae]|uniref:NAD(P)/FAD-dependent oxidoreductase n=1 Tax=Pseudoalteromonas pernae TaxID=3118054 RepID=UPI003241EAAC
MNDESIPRIVIVGGGAGGLELATGLGHKLGKKHKAEIILIDRNRTHIWKPLLHEVATGSLDASLDGVVYSAHAAKHHFIFQLGTFYNVDRLTKTILLAPLLDDRGQIVLPERALKYDKLILAIGSVSNDFSTPGAQEHCFFLDSVSGAERFQHTLLDSFTRLQQADENTSQLNVAIIGAGATGVELSAELYHVTSLLKIYGLDKVNKERLNIHLIEASNRILPALPERIATKATLELKKIGVTLHLGKRVLQIDERTIHFEDQSLDCDIKVWAAGVKAPDFLKELNVFELNRNNQIVVNAYLQVHDDENIYVVGDCCAFTQEDGSLVPPRAQSAHQMASTVKNNLIREYQGKALQPFIYKDHGSLVNLARFSAVGNLMGNLNSDMFIEGKIARWMYMSLYRMHQQAVHGTLKMMALWLSEKLMRVVRPKMKLH